MSRGSGARTDLLHLRDAVRDGKRGRQLFDDDTLAGSAIKYQRGIAALVEAYSEPQMRGDLRVVLHYGPPNTGKTHCCHSPDAYYFDGEGGGFWIGYKGETKVIFDEFSGATLRPLQFQRVCDIYPYWLNVKGSQVPCNVCISFQLTHVSLIYLIDY